MFGDGGTLNCDSVGPVRAFIYPAADEFNLVSRQRLAAHGHSRLLTGSRNSLIKGAVRGSAGTNTFCRYIAGVQPQVPHLRLSAVAALTGLLEDRFDIPDEIDGARRGWRLLSGNTPTEECRARRGGCEKD